MNGDGRHPVPKFDGATPLRVIERMRNSIIAGPSGCHISTYSTGSHGYSQIGWNSGNMRLGHRVMWEAEVGPIPPGMTIDHTCRTRRCVNVRHLRVLTNRENSAEGLKWRWRTKAA